MKLFCNSAKCAKPGSYRPVEKYFEDKDGKCIDCGYMLARHRDRNSMRKNVTKRKITKFKAHYDI